MFNKKAVFFNTASQVLVRFITLAFTLISIKLLTSYLGTAGVGQYNTIITYINFFIVIADLGLFAVTVREIAKNPADEKKIISNVFTLRLVSALIASIVAVVIVFFTDYDSNLKLGVLIAVGFLFFNLMASIYDIILQYRLKMQYSALAEFLSKLGAIIALYIIITNHGNFLWVMSSVAISGILIFLFKWFFGSRFLSFGPKYDQKIFRWVLNISWPIGLVFIISNLFFKLDTLMLFAIKGAATVGIYSVAYKILEVTAFIGSYFTSALKPALSENINKNKEFVSSLITKSLTVMLFVSLPISVVCISFSKEIILFLSTPDFLSGSKALIFLSLTLPLLYVDVLLAEILIANDERKLLIRIAIFILVFNLITNLIFIPLYSFMGAAFTTLLSEIVLFAIDYHYTQKIVKYKIDWGIILKLVLISAISIGFAMYLKNVLMANFIILIVITLAYYFALTFIFKVIKLSTIKSLLETKAKTSEL
jgi:O-antigen/teichoic acid export membrane protein